MMSCKFTYLVCSMVLSGSFLCHVLTRHHGEQCAFFVILGEDKFLTVQKKDVRTSKDWVGDKWVDVMANPDILSYISAIMNSKAKHSMCSTIGEAQHCGSSSLLEQKVITTSKLEAVKEVEAELAGSIMIDDLKNVKEVDMRKQPHLNVGNEINKGGDGDDGDVNDKNNKQDAGDETKMVLDDDDIESANQKKLVVEAQQVIA